MCNRERRVVVSRALIASFPKLKICVGILPKHEKQCSHMLHLSWHFLLIVFHRSHQFLIGGFSLSLGSIGENIEGS
jgi:hypothetical protein